MHERMYVQNPCVMDTSFCHNGFKMFLDLLINVIVVHRAAI